METLTSLTSSTGDESGGAHDAALLKQCILFRVLSRSCQHTFRTWGREKITFPGKVRENNLVAPNTLGVEGVPGAFPTGSGWIWGVMKSKYS